jgi:hypothetical protein
VRCVVDRFDYVLGGAREHPDTNALERQFTTPSHAIGGGRDQKFSAAQRSYFELAGLL